MNVTLLIALLLVGLLIFLIATGKNCLTGSRENYGGPVKKIRQIPFQNCQAICNTYYERCMQDFGDIAADQCWRRFKENCPSECYYSYRQRL